MQIMLLPYLYNIMLMKIVCPLSSPKPRGIHQRDFYVLKGFVFVQHHTLSMSVGHIRINLDWNMKHREESSVGHLFIENTWILMIKKRKCSYYSVQYDAVIR